MTTTNPTTRIITDEDGKRHVELSFGKNNNTGIGTNSSNDNNLWTNPLFGNIIGAMSEQEKEKFKQIGEHMYGNIDFDECTLVHKLGIPPPMIEATTQIVNAIASGLCIDDLDDEEIALLKEVYGAEWKDHVVNMSTVDKDNDEDDECEYRYGDNVGDENTDFVLL